MDITGSRFTGLKSLVGFSEVPKQCPECRGIVYGVRRYGRILRLKELRSLERKHAMMCNKAFLMLSAGADRPASDSRIEMLKKLEKFVRSSPMRKVFEACAGQIEFSPPPPAPLMRCMELQGIAHSSRASSFNDTNYTQAIDAYEAAIEIADVTSSTRTGAHLRLALGHFIAKHCVDLAMCEKLVFPFLDWILDHTVQFENIVSEATQLKDHILSKDRINELRKIAAAMNAVGGYNYGGSASDHWYECPNGHPFFISECGQAMETSICIECREPVGGRGHTLLNSNRGVTGTMRDAVD